MRQAALLLIFMFVQSGCAAPEKSQDNPGGSEAAPQVAPTMWMQKPDGSKQCGFAKGVEPEKLLNQLKSRGIKAIQARKGNDGLMHAMVCGGPTGDTVDIEIPVTESPKLKKLGFRALN